MGYYSSLMGEFEVTCVKGKKMGNDEASLLKCGHLGEKFGEVNLR